MTQKWNLQDIRPAKNSRPTLREAPVRRPQQDIVTRKPRVEEEEPVSVIDSDVELFDIIDGNSAKRKRVITTAIVAILILSAGFFVNVMLGGAEVTVYPKVKDVSVQSNFTAYTKPAVGMLGYELLSLEDTGEKQVKASGKEKVSNLAEGKIFVFNTKSTAPQRLIKNTRFESKDGLIFRIKESIEVPGATKDAKGNIVPGTIAADVFADAAGEQYNLAPQRFTVPGLKDSDQYASVYGESTSQFSGGFVGEKYIIDDAELQTAQQALHVELRSKLLERLKTERPAGFVIFDDSVTLTFETLPAIPYGDSLATIKEKAHLRVPMFKETDFSEYIAESTVPDYTGEMVTLPSPTTLAFSYESSTTTISDISKYPSIEFTLKGTSQLVWKFDEAKLKTDLVSLERSEANKILGGYAAIREAKADLRPFWKTTFPSNSDNISIKTIIELK